ncbi:MAG: hypothetical protein QOG93_969 [Gaiellaceae bacterium]|jgi:hypothetical protein|nr:hypothetical protein [Gaiellaceae bacterium]
MRYRFSFALVVGILLATTTGFADNARADGLPVLGVDAGATGVAIPGGPDRYVTIPAGSNTILARVSQDGGRILASRLLQGTFTIPAVAYDGSAGGISGDGRTLVLISSRTTFPRAQTTFALIDTPQLAPRGRITLQGDFSFDAISPRGASLYLIQYTSALDPTQYLVRNYDLTARRLVTAPVVDPHEPGEKMRGQPLTRATSRDGGWAYTLYDGAGKTPFIHALDTRRGSARCIDLDALTGKDLSKLRLKLDDSNDALLVVRANKPVLVVDRHDFAVTAPSAGGSGFPWLVVLVTVGVLGAVGAALSLSTARRGRRNRSSPVAVP